MIGLPQIASAQAIAISDFHRGEPRECLSLASDGKFNLSFVHSVSLTPVTDEYRLSKSLEILQTAERFRTHGQGLPSMDGEPNASGYTRNKDEFVLHMARPIPRLIVNTDARFRNRLTGNGQHVNLNQWPDTALLLYPVASCDDDHDIGNNNQNDNDRTH